MLEPAVVFLRLLQYAGAMVLFGSSLFFIYALPNTGPQSAAALGWPRRLLFWSAFSLFFGAVAGLLAQTSIMAGSIEEGLKLSSLGFVVSGTGLGRASLMRAAAGIAATVLLLTVRPGRSLWLALGITGALACGSVPWMGHGAATEGPQGLIHLISDMLHVGAAAVWLGALAAFLILVSRRSSGPDGDRALHAALHGFSGVGSALVAVLVASGLVNSWFLVGSDRLSGLVTTPYGQLLLIKLAVFALMLALASVNRFRLTPRLKSVLDGQRPTTGALGKLKTSLLLETVGGFAVLGLVAWLGSLSPVSAQ